LALATTTTHGDLPGRRRMFMAAVALFGVASLAGGLAPPRRAADRRPSGAPTPSSRIES
jgi:MFS family permease